MDAELEDKLREQLDRDEIWRVMQNYGRGLDRLDSALVRSCYWDDAIEDHGSYVGRPDEFIAWAGLTTKAFQSTQHGLLNHHCDPQGDDAYCETYFLFTGISGGPMNFQSAGRYVDLFQKRGGVWKIANRVCVIEGSSDIAASSYSGDDLPPVNSDDEPPLTSRDRGDVSYQRPLVPRRPKETS